MSAIETSPRVPSRRIASVIFISTMVAIVTCFALILLEVFPEHVVFLDNLHWTISYVVAGIVSWIGIEKANPIEARVRKYFAWGLSINGLGQILFVLQVYFDWKGFPAPSDACFSGLGLLVSLGFFSLLRAYAQPGEVRTILLDVASLASAVISLIMAIYLAKREPTEALALFVLAMYPSALIGATSVGIIAILTLRLKISWRTMTILIFLLATGAIGMQWNLNTLDDAEADGTWFNFSFSVITLGMGLGAYTWKTQISNSIRWGRICDAILRVIPLFLVIISAFGFIVAYTLPGVPEVAQVTIFLGGIVVVILAAIRQSTLLSERFRTEDELRASEGRFISAFEYSPSGMALVSPEGNWLRVNKKICEMLGYSAEELMNLTFQDITFPDDLQSDLDYVHRMLRGDIDTYEMEKRYIHKKGELVSALLSVSLVSDAQKKPLYFISQVIDITERKVAEEAVTQSEKRYRTLMEGLQAGIVVHNPKGIITGVNAKACEMLGVSADQLVGRPTFLRKWEFFSGDNSVMPEEDYPARQVARTLLPLRDFMQGIRKPNGELVWVLVNADPVLSPSGELLEIIVTSMDITATKLLEEQLRQSQKMEAIGTLAGGIAHDFNNLLGAIIGNVKLAKTDLNNDHPVYESLKEIQNASVRAKNLVQQILAFSRQQHQERRVIHVEPVINEALELLRATVPAGIELSFTGSDNVPPILADSTQLHQVVMNLVTNSWHAIENQTGRIEISLEVLYSMKDGEQDKRVVLSVSDTGHGIEDSLITRIFDPFFTTKAPGHGTGLGLPVVHGIVESHGGTIQVTSNPGSGTVFRLFFPAATESIGNRVEKGNDEELPRGDGQNILYVDDEEALVFLVKRLLSRLGYVVTGFSDPKSALAEIEKNPTKFDAIVADFNMPGMSGLDLAGGVRAVQPELPIIITSGYITEELREKAAGLGIKYLVYKPNTVEELCSALDKLLSKQGS